MLAELAWLGNFDDGASLHLVDTSFMRGSVSTQAFNASYMGVCCHA